MNNSVLISINTSWNIVHFRRALLEAIKASGHTIISVAPQDDYTPRLERIVDRHITIAMDNAGTSPWRDIQLCGSYLKLLRQVRPSVLLTYTIKPNIYGGIAAQILGIPQIANVSGLGTIFIRHTWVTKVAMLLYRVAFRRAACVFFQNPHDRNLFVQHRLVSADKAVLLNGSGVDLDFFHPRHNSKRDADAPTSFALIARLLTDKGIGEFVAAARMVKAYYPSTIFRLVGPHNIANQTAIDAATLNAWISEGVIEYYGETDDVRAVMANQDCIVLPSYREGMSRVLMEAAAMGKPIITTDVPGCADIVTHGENGFLCAARDTKGLATQIIEFLKLPTEARISMGVASRNRAERDFDQQTIISAYLDRIASATKSA